MKFDQLVALLPCYSLEDFDPRRKREDAEQLLSAWSALWHPLLLAAARTIPHWLPAASPPQELAGCLVILPDCSAELLPEDWLPHADAEGACVLRNLQRREDVLAAVLDQLGPDRGHVDPDLAADFLALGFCHLQVELLNRKMRYMSSFDETSLQSAALDAADAAVQRDLPAARRHLQDAFDRLHEAREYSYPTDPRLLDLTLVADTTLGEALRAELAGSLPRNLLISGEVLDEMARREPTTLDALRQALADNRAAVIGGEHVEAPLPLIDPEAIAAELRRGLITYQTHLARQPAVFGRRRFGLTPALPQIIERTGFTAALHCTLDDGRFPAGNQSRIQWEGIDGTIVEAIASLPIDADRPESLLALADKLSDTMSLDDTPTVMFAHWPGKSSPWYDDLRRIAAYGSVFGKFLTIADYFEQTGLSGRRGHYQPDEYRSPYLRQDVSAGRPDPISRWVRYYCRLAIQQASQTLQALAAICGGADRQEEPAIAIDTLLGVDHNAEAVLDDQLQRQLQESLARLVRSIAGPATSAERGCLTVNPCSSSRQTCVLPAAAAARAVSLDVPAIGFTWIGPEEPPAAPAGRQGWFGRRGKSPAPPLAEENLLRNEFFEVRFDPQTGAIRAISDYHSRGPRLAQQIALRMPHGGEPDADENYSIMAADGIVVTRAGPDFGEIQSRGRLLDREGCRVAGFRQTTRAWRGSPVIELLIELDVERPPAADPWQSYYAARFAWKDESSRLFRSTNLANLPTELTQFESPHFVDICRQDQHTTLLCGGLPYHRRIGLRKLDTLLVTRGETARSFRLGIGIDAPHPMSAALGFLSPVLMVPDQPPPSTPTGWLFHLDCRNVQATHWEALSQNDAGFRVRLLETDGRSVRLGLRCFRNVASACKINPGNLPPVELTVDADRISIPIGPHQWVEVEGRFASA